MRFADISLEMLIKISKNQQRKSFNSQTEIYDICIAKKR